jgi:oxygen-independent coproporphyrinogen-3 oxidase
MIVNIEQIRKYDVPGPRYTSYPPAVHFTTGLSAQTVVDEIRRGRTAARDLSLYVHLPFCKTLCWYCGCNTVITKKQSDSATYLSYLEAEFDIVSTLLGPARTVTQIHLGGGTPTFCFRASCTHWER